MSSLLQVIITPNATRTPNGALDVSKNDLSVSASLGQLRVVVLFIFINRMLTFLKRFDVVSKSAKKTAQKKATTAATTVVSTCCTLPRM